MFVSSSAPDPSHCVLTSIPDAVVAGHTAEVAMQAHDRHGGAIIEGGADVTVFFQIEGMEGAQQGVAIDQQNGVYLLRHTVSLACNHLVHVLLGGSPITESPVSVVVVPASPSHITSQLLTRDAIRTSVDDPIALTVQVADAFGNPAVVSGTELRVRSSVGPIKVPQM